MNFVHNPLGPICEGCELPQFIEQMSEVSPSFCVVCAEDHDLAAYAAKQAEGVAEFRYMSRYWLAVRPIVQTSLADLADAENAILESAVLARFMLCERFHTEALVSDREPMFSAERDTRELGSR
jgi:hypothetical protein